MFARFTRHDHSLASITAVWLQPSVSTIVSAATGAIVAEHLPAQKARITVAVSYILFGVGFIPALLIMAGYFLRLAVHKVRENDSDGTRSKLMQLPGPLKHPRCLNVSTARTVRSRRIRSPEA